MSSFGEKQGGKTWREKKAASTEICLNGTINTVIGLITTEDQAKRSRDTVDALPYKFIRGYESRGGSTREAIASPNLVSLPRERVSGIPTDQHAERRRPRWRRFRG